MQRYRLVDQRTLFMALVLCVVAVLGAPPVPAVVPACQNPDGSRVREHGFPLEDLNQDTTLDFGDLTLDEQLKFRFPIPENVHGPEPSYWDYVPVEFFFRIGQPRDEVEKLDLAEWSRIMQNFMALRRAAIRERENRKLTHSYLLVDWLYSIALNKEYIDLAEFVEEGGVAPYKIDKRLSWDVGTWIRDGMNPGRMWLMVAGLYVWNAIDNRPLGEEVKNELHIPDGYWQRFPKPEQPWNLAAERRRIREYLCSEPSLKFLQYRAENVFLKSSDEKIRSVGQSELDNIDSFIEKNIADFEQVFELLSPGTSTRGQFLELLASEEWSRRALFTLDNQGAAKTYIALRDHTLETVARYGDTNSVVYIWEKLPPAEKFVWPDKCLSHLEYPNATTAQFSWIMAPLYEATCDAVSPSRQEIYERYRPRL